MYVRVYWQALLNFFYAQLRGSEALARALCLCVEAFFRSFLGACDEDVTVVAFALTRRNERFTERERERERVLVHCHLSSVLYAPYGVYVCNPFLGIREAHT